MNKKEGRVEYLLDQLVQIEPLRNRFSLDLCPECEGPLEKPPFRKQTYEGPADCCMLCSLKKEIEALEYRVHALEAGYERVRTADKQIAAAQEKQRIAESHLREADTDALTRFNQVARERDEARLAVYANAAEADKQRARADALQSRLDRRRAPK